MASTRKPTQLRPRIVPSRDGGELPDRSTVPSPSDYEYFGLSGEERASMLKDKIGQQERNLFDIETGVAMLKGNKGGRTHEKDAPAGRCTCNGCELVRLTEMRNAQVYGLNALKALYRTI